MTSPETIPASLTASESRALAPKTLRYVTHEQAKLIVDQSPDFMETVNQLGSKLMKVYMASASPHQSIDPEGNIGIPNTVLRMREVWQAILSAAKSPLYLKESPSFWSRKMPVDSITDGSSIPDNLLLSYFGSEVAVHSTFLRRDKIKEYFEAFINEVEKLLSPEDIKALESAAEKMAAALKNNHASAKGFLKE